VDDEEVTCFKRNPPDDTGCGSITVVDDSTLRVIFDDVDFCYHHTDMTTTLSAGIRTSSYSPNLGYYCGRARRRRHNYGELQLHANGCWRDDGGYPWLDAYDTYYLRFKVSKIRAGAAVSGLALKTAVWTLAFSGGRGLPDAGEMGWRLPARRTSGGTIVFSTTPTSSRTGRMPRVCLQQKIVALRFRVQGNAKDSFFFDQIEL